MDLNVGRGLPPLQSLRRARPNPAFSCLGELRKTSLLLLPCYTRVVGLYWVIYAFIIGNNNINPELLMNRYQKVITCVIRFGAVSLVFYAVFITAIARIMSGPMWRISLVSTVPMLVSGVLLFALAIPLAKLIALGIRDD